MERDEMDVSYGIHGEEKKTYTSTILVRKSEGKISLERDNEVGEYAWTNCASILVDTNGSEAAGVYS
jgi:hypothetical protein